MLPAKINIQGQEYARKDVEHLAAAFLNMDNTASALKQVDWEAAIEACEKRVEKVTFKTSVRAIVNGSSINRLSDEKVQRVAASLLNMASVETALVKWAKAAKAAKSSGHPLRKDAEKAHVLELVRAHRALLEVDNDEDEVRDNTEEDYEVEEDELEIISVVRVSRETVDGDFADNGVNNDQRQTAFRRSAAPSPENRQRAILVYGSSDNDDDDDSEGVVFGRT